jgi:DNA repair exonuclease SbcCD ATPase subunit
MIEFKELTIKNFLSVGNQTQAVQLNKENLTLVIGENLDLGGDGNRNGVGKTTLCNALSYALFGVALNSIKKDNLINCVNNKNMLVSLTFSKNNVNYRIERGRRPNVMKFYVNDELNEAPESNDSQGDMRETQHDVNSLLGMSHDMFKHIVSLNTYTEPFLAMKANDQRVIIEQLLGITVLSEKAEVLKEQIKQSKDLICQENADIEAATKSNEKIQQSIDTLITRQQSWNTQHTFTINKINKEIAELTSLDIETELEAHGTTVAYNDQVNNIRRLKKEHAVCSDTVAQAEKMVNRNVIELDSMTNKICHVCSQTLLDHDHAAITAIVENNLTDNYIYFEKVNIDLTAIVAEMNGIGELIQQPVTYYRTIAEALQHQHNLQTLIEQLKIKNVETDPYQEQITQLSNSALQEINWNSINELSALKDHQEFLLKLLTNKDSFIRKKIIDQNLTYLNSRLTYYIDKMGLPHSVIFQNDLTVEITQLGQDLDFHNLSRGEMTRVILSLSMAFRDVWQSLYQSINLLFIDELADAGIDSAGLENLLSILKKTARETQKSVWIISHREELISRVDNILKVVKENGYTSFSTAD